MKGAVIGRDCNIGDHAFIETGARIGDRVTLKNQAMVWDGVEIGDDVFVGPGVSFTNDVSPAQSPTAAESGGRRIPRQGRMARADPRRKWREPWRAVRDPAWRPYRRLCDGRGRRRRHPRGPGTCAGGGRAGEVGRLGLRVRRKIGRGASEDLALSTMRGDIRRAWGRGVCKSRKVLLTAIAFNGRSGRRFSREKALLEDLPASTSRRALGQRHSSYRN